MIWMAIELSGTISAASVLVFLPIWINKGTIAEVTEKVIRYEKGQQSFKTI
jgi:hypothetical protein